MPRGRQRGSKNLEYDYPEGRNPPRNWSAKIDNFPQTRHALIEHAGAILPPDFGDCTAYKAFRLLWTNEIDEHILKRTNKRGRLNLDQSALHHFLLAGIIMCKNIRTDYKEHWSQNTLYENVEVKQLISRDKFHSILHHSHPKPLQLVKLANQSFQRHWLPYSHVSIDEGLICFKGRYQHRVHIRGKPDTTGLKVYGLADEKSYLYAFKLYEGQHEMVPDLVLSLMHQLPSCHYKLYLDSWYGSDSLAFSLLQEGFYFTMACGKNRPSEVFDDYLDIKLAKGQCRYLQSKQYSSLLALSYYDRAKCHFLTNLYIAGVTHNRKEEEIPSAVQDYRQHMGLIDRVDRSALKSTWPHRNKRWTMAFLWYLVGLCVSNAHKIYNDANPGRATLSMFIHTLIVEWRSVLHKTKVPRGIRGHRLISSLSKARCELCKQFDPNIAKTIMICTICEVHLHPGCFAKYHNND